MRICKVFLLCLIFFALFTVEANAHTVDDVRDLLNRQRVDDIYTQEEMDIIIAQYNKIERANYLVKLFDMGKAIRINDGLIEDYQILEEELVLAQETLAKDFQGGKAAAEVMKDKSTLESVLHKIDSLKDVGYEIELEYIPNEWKEKYEQVVNIEYTLRQQYEIGELGQGMKTPLREQMIIEKAFGLSMNAEHQTLSVHDAIDLVGSYGDNVYAQWNGVVSNIYHSDKYAYVIEITHGKGLTTVYKNLHSVKVNIGDSVEQYQKIAELGTESEKNHTYCSLHFEVYLDGTAINPIYLYGKNGTTALRTYVAKYPSIEGFMDLQELERIVKNTPDKVVEEEEISNIPPGTYNYDNINEGVEFSSKAVFEAMAEEERRKEENKNNNVTDVNGMTPDELEKLKKERLEEILRE